LELHVCSLQEKKTAAEAAEAAEAQQNTFINFKLPKSGQNSTKYAACCARARTVRKNPIKLTEHAKLFSKPKQP
jgi:hypothetical protein